MAWLTVDNNGDECIFQSKPHRSKGYKTQEIDYWSTYETDIIELPKGTIENRVLTWEDEPVELKNEQLCTDQ